MARARNIKPGLFRNEVLGVADPLYTLLFEGLWILADRAGRLEDRPLRIKADIFPYRDADADPMLDWLQENGFIRRYTVAGKRYILVLEFVKHQNPHKNEVESVIPPPSDEVPSVSEEIGTASEEIGSTRADPGFLIPDPLSTDSLISPNGEAQAKPARRPSACRPDDVAEQTWLDWQQLRKAKRAPVTETVVDGARREAGKAGMSLESFLQVWCRRGSQGLEAAWLKPEERGSRAPQSGSGKYSAAARAIWGGNQSEVIDAETH